MTWIDWVIVSAAAVVVVGYIAVSIWKKKTGRGGGCGCGCSGCPSAASCGGACSADAKKDDKTDEEEHA